MCCGNSLEASRGHAATGVTANRYLATASKEGHGEKSLRSRASDQDS